VYDPLTSRYSFPCPHGDEAHVPLSSFRSLERLPGASHPAVYHVHFACRCGDLHPGLVSHAELDCAPIGATLDCAPIGATARVTYRNLMTAHDDPLGEELVDLAATRIGAGEWPWSFYCCAEERARAITPSAFAVITPGEDALGVAVRCPSCSAISVNIVSRAHVDVPFWNDARVGVVGELSGGTPPAPEALLVDLRAARVDERRLHL
jgi:hypothetical protein